ncbi:MAG: dephospho-CoA kinase [Haliscomenobacter sp.]|jgi:dephospho-CoA kinase
MLHVGITGGIGTGKTTACKLFETLGIPVYYADDRARWLMEHDEKLQQGIVGLFGAVAYTSEGLLNRPEIARQAFGNPALLQKLNELTHPAVAQDGLEWQQACQGVPYTLKEAALLYESGSYRLLDKIIVVSAPLELRIARVMARDHCSREAVLERIARQMPQEEKEARADFILYNDGVQMLIPQVLRIHRILKGEVD